MNTNEITIDEMLEWVNSRDHHWLEPRNEAIRKAIRAILEQQYELHDVLFRGAAVFEALNASVTWELHPEIKAEIASLIPRLRSIAELRRQNLLEEKPTINELLEWTNEASTGNRVEDEIRDIKMRGAIRVILEQHEALQEAARRWEHFKAVSFLLSKEQ